MLLPLGQFLAAVRFDISLASLRVLLLDHSCTPDQTSSLKAFVVPDCVGEIGGSSCLSHYFLNWDLNHKFCPQSGFREAL